MAITDPHRLAMIDDMTKLQEFKLVIGDPLLPYLQLTQDDIAEFEFTIVEQQTPHEYWDDDGNLQHVACGPVIYEMFLRLKRAPTMNRPKSFDEWKTPD